MSHRTSELLTLQGNCKRDAESYRSDFQLQHTHYDAILDIFRLKPDQKSPELSDLILFLAHVTKCYPEDLTAFPQQLMDLLDRHGALMQSQLRMQIVQALILLRHKGVISPDELLPLCFRMFQCHDKHLKALLHSFIVSDIKNFNTGGRNDRLNRSIQNYLYKLIEGDSETVVKRALSVLAELWRRHVWRDARTVNVLASATAHESPFIMQASLKFFLGQDVIADDEEEEEVDPEQGPAAPTKDDVYKAYHKGTNNTKKKKIRKLKRVMGTVEKAKRKGKAHPQDSFAAMQLLHDPQAFAERLFAHCQKQPMRFEARLIVLQVVSRAIGVHELILENFYPYIQRYLQPSQREVVTVLAVVVQACHKLVPPDVVRPVLKQLVDQFVHDKARPEVMTVGLKTVRELCLRCPLVMDEALLSDLVLYRKERDKHVKNAAKALTGLFRELKPSMLEKKDRGRGADLSLQLQEYGAADIQDRVEGADLLEAALKREHDTHSDDASLALDSDSDDEPTRHPRQGGRGADKGGDNADTETQASGGESDSEDAEHSGLEGTGDDNECEASGSGDEQEEGEGSDAEATGGNVDQEEEGMDSGAERSAGERGAAGDGGGRRKRQRAQQESLQQLKRRLAESKVAAVGAAKDVEAASVGAEPIEYSRVLSQEDFAQIRKLKVKQMVEDAMAKHGLKSASARARIKERLFEEMEETLQEQEATKSALSSRVNPATLLGKRRGKADKAERMASVMAGRAGREEFGSSVGRKKQKMGGMSNVQKNKKKLVLAGAHKQQAANRQRRQKQRNNPKHQRGRASHGAWD